MPNRMFTVTPTPADTLRALDRLERELGFTDGLFRLLHHWGDRQDRDGSLDGHRRYLKRDSGSAYQRNSRNHILAQRIAHLDQHASNHASFGPLIVEAKEKYPFPS